MNSFPQFTTTIIDEDKKEYEIHFVALFSKKLDAVPLVCLHGWPGDSLCCIFGKVLTHCDRQLPRVPSDNVHSKRKIYTRKPTLSHHRSFSAGLCILIATPAGSRLPVGGCCSNIQQSHDITRF